MPIPDYNVYLADFFNNMILHVLDSKYHVLHFIGSLIISPIIDHKISRFEDKNSGYVYGNIKNVCMQIDSMKIL